MKKKKKRQDHHHSSFVKIPVPRLGCPSALPTACSPLCHLHITSFFFWALRPWGHTQAQAPLHVPLQHNTAQASPVQSRRMRQTPSAAHPVACLLAPPGPTVPSRSRPNKKKKNNNKNKKTPILIPRTSQEPNGNEDKQGSFEQEVLSRLPFVPVTKERIEKQKKKKKKKLYPCRQVVRSGLAC